MGLRGLAQWQRERALASNVRAGRYARGLARRAQREYVRRNWKRFVGVGGVLLGLVAVATPLFPGPFSRGLYLGSFSTAVIAMLAFSVVKVTGTAPVMMGDEAEGWTAQELRKLRRRGWKVINHVAFEGRDVDHVLIGPGGIFVVETKWTADEWKPADRDARVLKASAQVVGVTRTINLWLRQFGHDEVQPVIFLWGAGARELYGVQTAMLDDRRVTVVAGPSAKQWTAGLPGEGIGASQVQDAWGRLDAHCSRRDPAEDEALPVPPALSELVVRAAIALLAATASFLVAASWITHGLAARWWIPAAGVLGLPAVGLARFVREARYAAWGWLGGVLLSAGVVVYGFITWLVS